MNCTNFLRAGRFERVYRKGKALVPAMAKPRQGHKDQRPFGRRCIVRALKAVRSFTKTIFKRGFNNIFATKYVAINVSDLNNFETARLLTPRLCFPQG
jgi:hypothetical protein